MHERELFETYRKEVYRTCYFMLHHAENAEDACQKVFVSVFRHDWRRVAFLRTWNIRVTVNCCLNYMKQSEQRKRRENKLQLLSVNTVEKAAETVAVEQESAREVLWLLQRLPIKLRAAATPVALDCRHGIRHPQQADVKHDFSVSPSAFFI